MPKSLDGSMMTVAGDTPKGAATVAKGAGVGSAAGGGSYKHTSGKHAVMASPGAGGGVTKGKGTPFATRTHHRRRTVFGTGMVLAGVEGDGDSAGAGAGAGVEQEEEHKEEGDEEEEHELLTYLLPPR